MAYKVIFGAKDADTFIVDLETAKLNSKIEFAEEDTLLQIFVDSAASEIENYIGQPVMPRSATKFILDSWPASFNFPFQVNEVVSLKYRDLDYNEILVDPADYVLNNNCLIIKKDAPAAFLDLLIIECKAGFAAAEIPADIKKAALLIFSHSDTYRENMPIKLENTAKSILRPYKLY